MLNRPRKRQQQRQHEASQTRRQYQSWEQVLQEAQWCQCARCNRRQCVKGDLRERRCKKCGASLADATA